jgi:hypothetical protein
MCNYIHLMKFIKADMQKYIQQKKYGEFSILQYEAIYKSEWHFWLYFNDSSSLQSVQRKRYWWTDQLPAHFA